MKAVADAAKDAANESKKQLELSEEERRKLEKHLNAVRDDLDNTYVVAILCSRCFNAMCLTHANSMCLTLLHSVIIRKHKVDELHADKERHRGHTENLEIEKMNLENTRQKLHEELNIVSGELDKLKAANEELHRQRDNLEDEKDDLERETTKLQKEIQRLQGIIEQGDDKQSMIKEEFVHTKEQLAR